MSTPPHPLANCKLHIDLDDLPCQRTVEGERLPQRLLAQTFGQPGDSA